MSSRELLELFGVTVDDDPKAKVRTITIDWPPEDGAVALAMRGGERPEWQQMTAQIANESSVLRATYAQGATAEDYAARLWLSRAMERAHADELDRIRAEVEQMHDDDGGNDSMSSMWHQKEVN